MNDSYVRKEPVENETMRQWAEAHTRSDIMKSATNQKGEKSMRRKSWVAILAIVMMGASSLLAVEDGLGTNHVRTLRAIDGIVLDGQKITAWDEVSASTLTNGSISTGMIQDEAVTADKIAGAVAGDGLVGGAGSALDVNVGDGIQISGDAVAVDSSVIRTNGAQTIGGVKTFEDSPIVPDPTTDTQAASKGYVDGKLSSSVADGSAADDTLRWNGTAWTNSSSVTIDGSGNVAVGGTLEVTGIVTNKGNTVMEGDASVGGALTVTGDQSNTANLDVGGNVDVAGTLAVTGAQTNTASLEVQGNTVIGSDAADTVTFNAKAANNLDMDNNTVTGLAAPSAASDATPKSYVDAAINGLSWKQSVRVATTAAGALSTAFANGQTVDGITLATGDRILIKDQASPVQNGIYEVQAAGAPVRVLDMDDDAELAGAAVFVAEGTANAGSAWVVTTPTAAVDTDTITFTQFASPGTYTAGDGMDLTGLEFSTVVVDLVGAGLEDDGANNLRLSAAAAGDGLAGGAGSALSVNAGDGVQITGDAVAVDSSVIRTNGAQTIGGVKTFEDSPIVPDPTTDTQAASKGYVDAKLSSSVADGAAADQTLRWNGTAWTNSTALTTDASGNTAIGGTLEVTGNVTNKANTVMEGDASVAGGLTVTGTQENQSDLNVLGNVQLGDAGTDTITFNGKAASDLDMDSSYKITNLAAPASDGDAANKSYVDAAINGLSWKQSVRAASSAAGTLSSGFANGSTIDGVTLATGDRILIKDQASAVQNGIYIVQAAGAPVRATDLDATSEIPSAAVFVEEGTANAGSAWVCTTPTAVLDTDDLTFTQFASPGTYTAGDGLTLSGLEFAVSAADFAGSGLEENAGDLRLSSAAAGDGLTGGGGSALAVDASVIRTNGAQTIGGVKTFEDSPIVPDPTTDTQAASKGYVDAKLSSSVADGAAASQVLRWNGNAWTNTGEMTLDASGNMTIAGTVSATGAVTVADTTTSTTKDTGALVVEGGVGIEENLNVGGTAGITGAVTLSDVTSSTTKDTGALIVEGGVGVEENLNVGGNVDAVGTLAADGNVTLGDDAAADTLTVNAETTLNGSLITAPSGLLDIEAATGITAAHASKSYLTVRGSGGPIDITVNPQIAAGTAGQMLTLQGSSDINTLKLDDGAGLAMNTGISFTLKDGHIIQFIYDGSVWRETFRTVHQ